MAGVFGTLVNTGTNVSSASVNTLANSTSLAPTIGNLLVAVAQRGTTGLTITFTDNLSHTWHNLNTNNSAGGTFAAAYTIITLSSANITVTSSAGTSAQSAIVVGQYSGPFNSSTPLNVNPSNFALSAVTNSSSPATGGLVQAQELVVSYTAGTATVTYTASAPLTASAQIAGTTVMAAAMGSEVVSSTASISPTWSISASQTGWSGVASFKSLWFGTMGGITEFLPHIYKTEIVSY